MVTVKTSVSFWMKSDEVSVGVVKEVKVTALHTMSYSSEGKLGEIVRV